VLTPVSAVLAEDQDIIDKGWPIVTDFIRSKTLLRANFPLRFRCMSCGRLFRSRFEMQAALINELLDQFSHRYDTIDAIGIGAACGETRAHVTSICVN